MALQLGDDFDGAAGSGRDVAFEVVDHVSALDEGDGDEVHALADGEVDVQPVLQAPETLRIAETLCHVYSHVHGRTRADSRVNVPPVL